MKLTKEFIEAVRQLDKAFAKLDEVWDANHDNSVELGGDYPFDSSIAELAVEVGNWRDAVEVAYTNPLEDFKQHMENTANMISDALLDASQRENIPQFDVTIMLNGKSIEIPFHADLYGSLETIINTELESDAE